jgi:hypothetical protein
MNGTAPFLFFDVWFQRRRAKRLLESINDKYLGCSHSIKTIGCERSCRRERSPPSPPLHTHMTLQPNNERSGSALFYSSTKQKIKRFRSAHQTQNEIAQLLNQTHSSLQSPMIFLLLNKVLMFGSGVWSMMR